jgi:hypothetical protein
MFIVLHAWWARLKTGGIPACVIDYLIARIFSGQFFDGPHDRYSETIDFFSRYHGDMDHDTVSEVNDSFHGSRLA